MENAHLFNISLLVVSGLVCLILLICVLIAGHLKEKLNRLFIYILFCQIPVIIVGIVIYYANGGEEPYTFALLTAMSFLSFAFGILLGWIFTWYFYSFLKSKTELSNKTVFVYRIAFLSCCVNMLFTVVSLFNGMYFYINESNRFVLGDWHLLSQILGFFIIFINGGIIAVYRKVFSRRELAFLLSYFIMPLLAMIILNVMSSLRASFDVATTMTILVFYIGIQSDIQNKFKQNEIDSRIAIMLSQIQPHFLHNALTAIAQLCDDDPKMAKKATIDFSVYLRGNMDSLADRRFISIKKELSHVRGYLDLVSAIYGGTLSVVYDIKPCDFMLPPLTIQPIVENAVKHGVSKRDEGGSVTISVCDTDAEYIITVIDDGIGYDTSAPLNDNRAHIGIDNVKRRLAEQCGGTLDIKSERGKGTTALIKVPK